jgi:O-antigen/teichoic acid export membrane protein
VVIGVAGVLVAAVIGKPVLSIIYSPEYAQHNRLLVLIMVAGGVSYVGSLMGSPVVAMRHFREILWVYLGNTLFLLVLAWYLIPRYGMMGAAWAMLGGALWVLVGTGWLIFRGISQMENLDGPSSGTGA